MGIVRKIAVRDVLVLVQDVVLELVKGHASVHVATLVLEDVPDIAIILAAVAVEVHPTKLE